MDGLQWQLKFEESMSGPTSAADKALLQLDATLKQTNEALLQLEQHQGTAGKASEAAGSSIFSQVFSAELAKDALEELGRTALELGEEFFKSAVEASDFADRTENALEVVMGSSDKAREAIEAAEHFSFAAALPVEQTVDAYRELVNAKFKPVEIPTILAGASDLSKMGSQSFDQIAEMFTEIGNRGELSGLQLRTLAASGLDVESMAHKLGAHDFRELQTKLMTAPVSAAEGINAILSTLQEKEHGVLGALTVKDADTVSGSIQKIKTGWEEMLESVGTAPEFGEFRTDLSEIADLFNPATAGGKEFERELAGVLATGGRLFHELAENKDTFVKLFDGAVTAAGWAVDAIEGTVHSMEKLGAFAGTLAGGGSFREALEAERDVDRDAALQRAGGAVPSSEIVNENQANAPLPPLPHLAAGGDVMGPTVALIGEEGPERVRPLGSAGGGDGVTVHIAPGAVVVQSCSHGHGEQTQAEQLEELLPGAVERLADLIATEMGGG